MPEQSHAHITALCNGKIYGFPEADTIVLERDRIRAVGLAHELDDLWTEGDGDVLDLHGRFVLPGFVDAHIHLLQSGLEASGWLIGLAGLSRRDTLDALAEIARQRDGEWVVAYGWDESTWEEHRYLDREELDGVAPACPVLATRLDGHLVAANSAALACVPASAPDDLIDRVGGWLREAAVTEMMKTVRPDEDAVRNAFTAAAQTCHRLGITTVHTMTDLEHLDAVWQHRDERRLRVIFCPMVESLPALMDRGLKTGHGDDWLRFGGVKMFADGSIGAGNAAVSIPFCEGGCGALNHDDETLRNWVTTADRDGWQTIVHAIGDRAIDQVLRVHEGLATDPSLRHRIEHFELPSEAQVERTAASGLFVSMQPNFTANWSGSGGLYDDRLGADRDRRSNPLRELTDAGIPLAFGSDGMPPGPLYGLHGAINGPFPNQRITLDEALVAYTQGGAAFEFEEDEKGTLHPGKVADLVVLDCDPTASPDRLLERTVDMTFVGGRRVYARQGDI